MNQTVEIDETDIKILRMLINDARTKLNDIAENCGVSSNAIFKRVKRLKAAGVITGTTLFINTKPLGLEQSATLGINLEPNQEKKVANLIRKHAHLVHLDTSFGKYDMCAFIIAKNIEHLELLKQTIRKHPGVKRIAVNLWNKAYFSLGDVGFQPNRAEPHGRT
ncbi:MAG: Lrp/AsnC family transcriptional regulator [Crenarchaeota archaeon]|nr:Lrp/AsnC family transcriptional regulator [Thermoproteota archaeon]